MAAFLETQLDFILFACGLGFILLGAVCCSIARAPIGKLASLGLLGLFGFVHGAGEWLDLSALVVDDSLVFMVVRTAVMAGSYLLLLEFARAEAVRLGARLPGAWIHIPLALALAAIGARYGVEAANVAARYGLGFVGALGAAVVMAARARSMRQPSRRLVQLTATGFALYAVVAGLIGPAAPFWPATAINQLWFVEFTGVPIQLVRGVLACTLAVLIWALWGRILIAAVESDRYASYLRRHFIGTLSALAAIFIGGWMLTNYLGGINEDNVRSEARGDIDLLVSRLGSETGIVTAMSKALAGSPTLQPLLHPGANAAERKRAQSVLNLDVEASGALVGEIIDRASGVVASSRDLDFALLGAAEERAAHVQSALAGNAASEFVRTAGGERIYLASHPVRDENGAVIGAAVLVKSLDPLQAGLLQFDRPFFLIDAEGLVMLTNRLDLLDRPLWSTAGKVAPSLTQQFGALPSAPMLSDVVATSAWTRFDGTRSYVLRAAIPPSAWSMVIVTPISGMFANRSLGIIITLQLALTALFHFFGREHAIRDSVQLQRRLELQDIAKSLELRATTDPLTRLFNRAKFDEALVHELGRSQRYHTPLSLVVYDIDHFKKVNDRFGHPMGDSVLLRMAELVSGEIRNSDLLARWGGEEFVVLLPDTGGEMARLVAEKLRLVIAQATFDRVGTVTCSFGVAACSDTDTPDSLISRADDALYRAKLNGRNRVELAAARPIKPWILAAG
jgi:diguanylate cyclase (GGDEF)-like protein